jgi:hypothetical protein
MKIMIPIKYMAKNLASKLRTGAMIGLAGLALGATAPKANAGVIYDSGYQYVEKNVPLGKLAISYQQIIEDVDTNGDSIFDSYHSKTYIKNETQNISSQDSSFFIMNMNADLAGRGATDMIDMYSQFHYEKSGENTSRMILNSDGEAISQTLSDTFYYTIPTNQVLGWENVGASMVANAGSVNFGFQAPIPEPLSAGLLASGAVALLAGRRIRENAKRR